MKTQGDFLAEFGFMPNDYELAIANGRNPRDASQPFSDGDRERYPRAWRLRGQRLKAENGTRHLTEPNVYPASTASKRQVISLADVPCKHRGQPLAEMKCKPCTKGANADVMVPVCRCEFHDTFCTAANTGEQYQGVRPRGCSTCGDRDAAVAVIAPAITRKLTIGMATFDDAARVRWTIAALKAMYEDEFAARGITWEIVVVNNNPQDGDGYENHTRHLSIFNDASTPPVRVVMCSARGTFPPKAHVFDVAAGEIVIVIDCHVIPRGIGRAIEWLDANPDFDGLFTGPLLDDQGRVMATHQEREFRDNMLACWQKYDRPDAAMPQSVADAGGDDEFGERVLDIPQQGAFLFGCRRDAWPRDNIPKNLRGFGGDENVHALFRSLGRRVVSMEWLASWHDFIRMGQLYGVKGDSRPSLLEDRFRNDVLWFQATGETHRIVEAIEHYTSDRLCNWNATAKKSGVLPMQSAISILKELGLHEDETRSNLPSVPTPEVTPKRSGQFRFAKPLGRALGPADHS